MTKVHLSPDMVTIYDKELTILAWNLTCEKKYSIPASYATGKNLLDLFPYIKKDYRVSCLREVAQDGKTFYFANLPYEYADGFYTQLMLPFIGEDGKSSAAINIVRDHEPWLQPPTRKELILPLLLKDATFNELMLNL